MGNVFPIVNIVKERGAGAVVKESLIPAISVLFLIVPQSLAYALLADVPPIYGLYSSAFPLLAYTLLGTSGQVAAGPVAMLSLLSADAISMLPNVDPADKLALIHLLTFMLGMFSVILGLLRLGNITQLLSHEVLSGFTTAAAIIIGSSQLKYVFGVQIGRHRYPIGTLIESLSQIPNANIVEVSISAVSFVVLILLKIWQKRNSATGNDGARKNEKTSIIFKLVSIAARFSALFVVGLGSIIAGVLMANGINVKVVGKQPTGIPAPSMMLSNPSVLARLPELILPSFTMALIGFAETYAAAKAYDENEVVEPNRELVAMGTANVVGSFLNAIPVAGSLPRTAVNADAGSKTTLSNFFTGLGVILVLLLLSPIIEYVPYSTLASIIITAVVGLVKVEAFKQAWKVHRSDFVVLIMTLVATLGLGIETGIAIGAIVSILNIIRENASPHMPLLGKVDTEGPQWRDIERSPNANLPPNSLVFRLDSSLFFGNSAAFKKKVISELNVRNDSKEDDGNIDNVIIDLTPVNRVDLSGLLMLSSLEDKLKADGIALAFVGAKGAVRDTFQRWVLASERDLFQQYPTVQKAIQPKTVDVVIDNQVETKVRFRETKKVKKKVEEVGESKTEDSHGSPIGVRDIEMV